MCLSLEICARPAAGLGLKNGISVGFRRTSTEVEASNENHPGFHRGGDFDVS
jgi:hypothetical protein